MIGQAKADAAGELMARHRIDPRDCHAYGDHSSDLPLLEQVGHPVVVGGGDPALIRHARPDQTGDGWCPRGPHACGARRRSNRFPVNLDPIR